MLALIGTKHDILREHVLVNYINPSFELVLIVLALEGEKAKLILTEFELKCKTSKCCKAFPMTCQ